LVIYALMQKKKKRDVLKRLKDFTDADLAQRRSRLMSMPSAVTSAARQQVEPKRLDLDTTTFAPLSDEQIKASAGAGSGVQLWGSAWFGRRDLIPPADDPRTNLIDRGMVAHGLIKPEELLEIHKIGAEMDKIRPDIAMASHVAQQAVTDDREARKALREQKKRQAEERKRAHTEAVAKRRATDIIFLGRGVSRGLADRRSNVE